MDRFKLNFYQILGLMTYSIGAIVQGLAENSIGLIIIFFGLLFFFVSSKFNIGFVISFVILAVGYQFKIMHWPKGNEIILLGMIGFLVSAFFKYIYKTYKMDFLMIYISLTVLVLGMYFKIVHLKYSKEIILIGFLAITVSYAFRFIKKIPKYFEDFNKMILVFFWSLSSVVNIFHWLWSDIFSLMFILILWTWLITSLIRELRMKGLI